MTNALKTEDYSTMAPANEPTGPVYLLDGEPLDLREFLQENEDLDVADVFEIRHLEVGQEIVFAGGACPSVTLKRVG